MRSDRHFLWMNTKGKIIIMSLHTELQITGDMWLGSVKKDQKQEPKSNWVVENKVTHTSLEVLEFNEVQDIDQLECELNREELKSMI